MNDSAATSAAFVVRQGNNMPVHAPLIPDPFVPYHCPGNANLFVICRTDPARLAKYLAPTPFEAIDDRYVIYVSDFSNCDKAVYMDTGIIVLVRFGERTGGYYLFVYEDNEVAISAGRDLWGYAKKYAEPTMTVEGGRVSSRTVRHGEAIIELDCDLSKPVADLPRLVTTPHLNIHVQPGPDGRVLNKRVIERDTSPGDHAPPQHPRPARARRPGAEQAGHRTRHLAGLRAHLGADGRGPGHPARHRHGPAARDPAPRGAGRALRHRRFPRHREERLGPHHRGAVTGGPRGVRRRVDGVAAGTVGPTLEATHTLAAEARRAHGISAGHARAIADMGTAGA